VSSILTLLTGLLHWNAPLTTVLPLLLWTAGFYITRDWLLYLLLLITRDWLLFWLLLLTAPYHTGLTESFLPSLFLISCMFGPYIEHHVQLFRWKWVGIPQTQSAARDQHLAICDVFTGFSDTNLPRVRVSAKSIWSRRCLDHYALFGQHYQQL
jgi:hypothetical protein